jgi:hypothetical protein
MHKGRPYPFHPSYWSTEAWFYHGFMPWKMFGDVTGSLMPPWNALDPSWSGISDPGIVNSDRTIIRYHFDITPPSFATDLDVNCELSIISGTKWARWRAYIGDGGPAWSEAILLQDFPQRVVLADGFDFALPAPPYTSAAGPPLRFRPATYAEGGSPWPG